MFEAHSFINCDCKLSTFVGKMLKSFQLLLLVIKTSPISFFAGISAVSPNRFVPKIQYNFITLETSFYMIIGPVYVYSLFFLTFLSFFLE